MPNATKCVLVAGVVTLSALGAAHADDAVPAVPIRDLPPFPDVAEGDDPVSEVSVYGATLAEEETVVGASKREQSLGTVASAVTVLTSDTIRRYGYRTLAEALRGVGGIFVVDDRMVERIGVRGVQLLGDANTRILILIDGTPLNEPWSQFVDGSSAIPVSLDDVARIEIIRGPVSSIYGTNAFLGIINIVTIEADKAPRAYGRATAGTFGTLGANAAFNQGEINRQFRGSVSYQHRFGEAVTYPDFPLSPGEISADGAHALFGSFAVTYDRLFFQTRGYERKRVLPGAPYDSELNSDDNANTDRHVLAELGYTNELSKKLTIAARAYANRYTFNSELDYDNTAGNEGAEFVSDAKSVWYGGELRALVDVLDQANLLSTTAGVAFELTQTESTATTNTTPIEKNFNIAGAYVDAASQPNKWLGFSVGARFDRNSEFQNKLSPRAALFLHKGEDYGLKLLYAEGFRNPSIFEAYYNDNQRFEPALTEGVTQLESETIKAYELVFYGRPLKGVKLRVSFWEWRMDELLKRTEVFIPPPINAVRLRFQNSGPLVSRGVEVESTYRDVEGRSAYLNVVASFTGRNCLGDQGFGNLFLDDAPDKGNCDPRQNAPVIVAKTGVSSQLLMESFHLSGELSYISERGTQDPNETVPAYLGLNLIGYAPDVNGFDLTLGLRNLIGREHVPAQSEYNRTMPSNIDVLEVPGPGREIFFRAGRKF